MIAFALRETGRDPSWIVGGEVPQLGANAGAGEGWLVVEGDESDRSVFALRPQVAVVTNIDLDHHSEFGSRAEVEELFRPMAGQRPGSRAGLGARAAGLGAGGPRRAQPPQRGGGGRRGRAGGRPAGRGDCGRRVVPGRRPAVRARRYCGRDRRLRRLRAQPAEGARGARDRTGTERRTCARALPAASLLPDAPLRRSSSAGSWPPPTWSRSATSTRRGSDRSTASPGSSSSTRCATPGPGSRRAGAPTLDDGVRFLVRRARPGDLALTVGAGDVDRAARAILAQLGRS